MPEDIQMTKIIKLDKNEIETILYALLLAETEVEEIGYKPLETIFKESSNSIQKKLRESEISHTERMFSHLDFKALANEAKEELDEAKEDCGDEEIEFHHFKSEDEAKIYRDELNKATVGAGIEAYVTPSYGGYIVWVRYE